MEKNTILAIVLSVAVFVIFSVWQGTSSRNQIAQTSQQTVETQVVPQTQTPVTAAASPADPAAAETQVPAETGRQFTPTEGGPHYEQIVPIETDLLEVKLTNIGGDIVSLRLKEHTDKDDKVEMILQGDNPARAFSVALGGLGAEPLSSFFHVNQISSHIVEFFQDFSVSEGQQFRLTKRYEFKPDEYMFELRIILDGGHSMFSYNFNGSAYTLSFGPQIGPRFVKLDNRFDFRQYLTFSNGKRKTEKIGNGSNVINTNPSWAAISGKYFALIAVPSLQYDLNFSEKSETGLISASRMNIIRPPVAASRTDDSYRFYLGPKNQRDLVRYNVAENNGFGLRNMQLAEAANTRGILAPLEWVLKRLLQIFYRLIPNYGIAIILVTLVVKIVFFPLTRKSSEATLRMQSVAPKIKEIQEKYKGNPQKMNAEMAELYKKEGYNPLSGCLPMLLQLPIFFAMYSLFNNHFDLRGAMFIPGWIPDLSLPESIWEFPEGFRLPVLGWTALRLMPFIYVASQLIYGKVTQVPGQQSNTQMKMMLYVLPIVFFFVLYNVPSGLLLYWIFSNLFTMVQQVVINKYLAPKRAAQAAAQAEAAAAQQAQAYKKKKK